MPGAAANSETRLKWILGLGYANHQVDGLDSLSCDQGELFKGDEWGVENTSDAIRQAMVYLKDRCDGWMLRYLPICVLQCAETSIVKHITRLVIQSRSCQASLVQYSMLIYVRQPRGLLGIQACGARHCTVQHTMAAQRKHDIEVCMYISSRWLIGFGCDWDCARAERVSLMMRVQSGLRGPPNTSLTGPYDADLFGDGLAKHGDNYYICLYVWGCQQRVC